MKLTKQNGETKMFNFTSTKTANETMIDANGNVLDKVLYTPSELKRRTKRIEKALRKGKAKFADRGHYGMVRVDLGKEIFTCPAFESIYEAKAFNGTKNSLLKLSANNKVWYAIIQAVHND